MENQQPEALILANDRPSAIGDDLYQWALDAEDMIRRLHARVEELEKDRGNAKRLVSKIWNQHPEARDMIEKATGAWLVFGQDVETGGVSAQRVTQQAHSTERESFEKWAVSDFSGINVARDGDDYSFVPAKEWWRAWQARAALDADHIAQDRKMVAAQVVLPEPYVVHHIYDAWSDYGAEDDAFLNDGIEEKPQGKVRLFSEAQVRDLLAKATCTKSQTGAQEPFGYFKAEPFGWRDCAETDEGAIALYEAPQPPVPSGMRLVNAGALQMVINALLRDAEEGKAARGEMADELLATGGQPQADARDAQRYRWLRAQPLESDMFCTTIWRKGTDGFGDDLRLEKLDAAIDAAIAASKENK